MISSVEEIFEATGYPLQRLLALNGGAADLPIHRVFSWEIPDQEKVQILVGMVPHALRVQFVAWCAWQAHLVWARACPEALLPYVDKALFALRGGAAAVSRDITEYSNQVLMRAAYQDPASEISRAGNAIGYAVLAMAPNSPDDEEPYGSESYAEAAARYMAWALACEDCTQGYDQVVQTRSEARAAQVQELHRLVTAHICDQKGEGR